LISEYEETTGCQNVALKLEVAMSPKLRQNSLLENNDIYAY
jgi:hypothetical protein